MDAPFIAVTIFVLALWALSFTTAHGSASAGRMSLAFAMVSQGIMGVIFGAGTVSLLVMATLASEKCLR